MSCAGSQVEIAVRDSGQGIEPGLLSRLMSEQLSFGKEKGNGLGLYHARKCIEDWGGTINITSAVGKGCQVLLTLPIASSSARSEPSRSEVVLIDDDVWIREAWSLAGKQVGVEVSSFATLEEFLKSSSEVSFDVQIYIDYELDGDRGDRVGKVLYESGYRNLYLATGHAAEDLASLPFFKSVVGKDPPF